MFLGNPPRQDRPLPKVLDDPTASRLLRATQAPPMILLRVAVEDLLRSGMRVRLRRPGLCQRREARDEYPLLD